MTEGIGEGMRRLWSTDLQSLVVKIRNGEFKYEEKDKTPIDWSRYDEAQLDEIVDMLQIIEESVNTASDRIKSREPKRKRLSGRPPISPQDIAKVMLLQCYFGFSNRVAAGFLQIVNTIKFSTSFSYKTIERGYDPERTRPLFNEIFKLTNEWSNFNEDIVGIDGTGDPTTSKVNYEGKRSEQRNELKDKLKENTPTWPGKKYNFQYSTMVVGVHSKIIAGFSTTEDRNIGELSLAKDAMKQAVNSVPHLSLVVGDTLYANRPFCEIVSSCGAALYSIPKSNSTLRSQGVYEWSRLTYELILDPQGFLQIFHSRSLSETVNSMMKRRELTPIRKRLPWRRKMEEYLKVNIHNLRQSCYLTYVNPALTKLSLGG